MKTLPSLLLVVFLSSLGSISSQATNSTDNNSSSNTFLTIATAILQNKNTTYDTASYQSTFANWQGSGFNSEDYFGFNNGQGMIMQTWQTSEDTYYLWNFNLRLFDGNYIDQKQVVVSVQIGPYQQMYFNQYNGTIIIYDIQIQIQDPSDDSNSNNYYTADLYIYFVDKTTKQPPYTYDTDNLKSYTYQIRLETRWSSLQFTSSFFDDSYQVSQEDQIYLMIGCAVYFVSSFAAIYIRKPTTRKISGISIQLLIFFTMYIMFYIGAWFWKIRLMSDLLYYFIPVAAVVFLNFIKHIVELYKNGDNGCCLVCLYPVVILFMIAYPEYYGVYIGDGISCLFLLPQIILKFQERQDRRKQLTSFEIGNWICILLWVLYLDLYPNNVFLSSPKPILVLIHGAIILIQFFVLAFLQFAVKRKNTFKYTFAVNDDSQAQEKLLSEQCAICIEDFEMNSKEKLYKTPCGHFFHSECLKSWGGKKLDCPVCRAEIPGFIYPVD